MRKIKRHGFVFLILTLSTLPARTEIVYDEKENALKVWDYPQAIPCGLERLVTVDKTFGWNKVQYDKAADTYTVNCDLWIGANNGTDTYFQIGAADRPRETLIMNGNLFVQPHWVKGENKGARWWYAPDRVNRLTIGDRNNDKVKPVVKFAPDKTLYSGMTIRNGKPLRDVRGGQLFVYNGAITALKDFFGGAKNSGLFLYGDGAILVNAEVSRVNGNTCYGMGPGWKKEYRVENAIFSDFGFIAPGKQEFVGCVFRGAREYAIADWGGIDATFANCRFENNHINFFLRYSDKGVTCVDCDIASGKKPDIIVPGAINGKKNYPALIIQRHVIVQVVSNDGKPVVGAIVTFKPEQPGSGLLENVSLMTGADGCTPSNGNKDALLLTESVTKATDDPNKPNMASFTYAIFAEKSGKKASVKGINPSPSWKTVTIRLN